METAKSERIVFRNAGQRIYYLRKRMGQPDTAPNFVFEPGMTVEALDEAEELILASMSDLRDVKKETPSLANNIASLQKQLAEERAKNETLLAEKAALEGQKQSMERQRSAELAGEIPTQRGRKK